MGQGGVVGPSRTDEVPALLEEDDGWLLGGYAVGDVYTWVFHFNNNPLPNPWGKRKVGAAVTFPVARLSYYPHMGAAGNDESEKCTCVAQARAH